MVGSVDVLAARTLVVIPLDTVDPKLSLTKWFGVVSTNAIAVPADH